MNWDIYTCVLRGGESEGGTRECCFVPADVTDVGHRVVGSPPYNVV